MGASGSKPTNQTVDPLTTNDKPKPKTLCKFYQKGKCRHNDNCRFDHPKICYKFRAFGLKTHNEKGCETNCSYFHPNACRDSLKTKTCPREECRFYHLKGTKTVSQGKSQPQYNKLRQSGN